MDDKAMFAWSLGKALNLFSREAVERIYLEDEETAIIVFENGYQKKVNVACSSPLAMMNDIYRALL